MKILIIDDEPLVRKALKKVFLSKGHDVMEAKDGIEGKDCWDQFDPDVVLIDVLMPGMSGFQLLTKIPQGKKEKTKIVLMSAYLGENENEYNKIDLSSEKIDLFLSKPFNDIFETIQKVENLIKKGDNL